MKPSQAAFIPLVILLFSVGCVALTPEEKAAKELANTLNIKASALITQAEQLDSSQYQERYRLLTRAFKTILDIHLKCGGYYLGPIEEVQDSTRYHIAGARYIPRGIPEMKFNGLSRTAIYEKWQDARDQISSENKKKAIQKLEDSKRKALKEFLGNPLLLVEVTSREYKDKYRSVESLLKVALILANNGNSKESDRFFQMAINLASEVDPQYSGVSRAYSDVIEALARSGRVEDALDLIGSTEYQASALEYVVRCIHPVRHKDSLLDFAETAEPLPSSAGSELEKYRMSPLIAIIQSMAGNNDKVGPLLRNALRFADRLENPSNLAEAKRTAELLLRGESGISAEKREQFIQRAIAREKVDASTVRSSVRAAELAIKGHLSPDDIKKIETPLERDKQAMRLADKHALTGDYKLMSEYISLIQSPRSKQYAGQACVRIIEKKFPFGSMPLSVAKKIAPIKNNKGPASTEVAAVLTLAKEGKASEAINMANKYENGFDRNRSLEALIIHFLDQGKMPLAEETIVLVEKAYTKADLLYRMAMKSKALGKTQKEFLILLERSVAALDLDWSSSFDDLRNIFNSLVEAGDINRPFEICGSLKGNQSKVAKAYFVLAKIFREKDMGKEYDRALSLALEKALSFTGTWKLEENNKSDLLFEIALTVISSASNERGLTINKSIGDKDRSTAIRIGHKYGIIENLINKYQGEHTWQPLPPDGAVWSFIDSTFDYERHNKMNSSEFSKLSDGYLRKFPISSHEAIREQLIAAMALGPQHIKESIRCKTPFGVRQADRTALYIIEHLSQKQREKAQLEKGQTFIMSKVRGICSWKERNWSDAPSPKKFIASRVKALLATDRER